MSAHVAGNRPRLELKIFAGKIRESARRRRRRRRRRASEERQTWSSRPKQDCWPKVNFRVHFLRIAENRTAQKDAGLSLVHMRLVTFSFFPAVPIKIVCIKKGNRVCILRGPPGAGTLGGRKIMSWNRFITPETNLSFMAAAKWGKLSNFDAKGSVNFSLMLKLPAVPTMSFTLINPNQDCSQIAMFTILFLFQTFLIYHGKSKLHNFACKSHIMGIRSRRGNWNISERL